jgi:hypothetical protein
MGHDSTRQRAETTTVEATQRRNDLRRFGTDDVASSHVLAAAGNLALSRALAARGIRTKLAVSQPGDPEEEEADRMADAVVSRSVIPVVHRKCDACAAGKTCEACEEDAVHRKRDGSGSSAARHNVAQAVDAVGAGGGMRLPAGLRDALEPRFGRDFSAVHLHVGGQAGASARAIGARAYTVGSHIAFAPGEFRPHEREGQRLLAHELTHVAQQQRTADAVVRRGPLDPANTAAWDWYGKLESHRKDESYLQTVGAASGAATALGKSLAESGAPKTDDERDAFEKKARTLIRLNAIAMVGAHRAELAQRKQMFESMAAKPTNAPGQPSTAENPKAADTAKAIRAAAQSVTKLNADKETLQGLKNHIESAVRVNAGAEAIKDEYQTLWDNAQPRSSPAILQRVLQTQAQMEGVSWGTKKVRLMDLSRDLSTFRKKQIQGLDAALALVYEAFPFFADMPAKKVTTGAEPASTGKALAFGLGLAVLGASALAPLALYVAHDALKKDQPPDDQTLLADVQASFDRLLDRTDEAIVKIGSGSMEVFNLPGAVAATRKTLPPPLQAEIDRMQKEHEVWEFTKDMIMALGLAVLTGLTGGAAAVGAAAWAAAGGTALATIGVAQVGGQLKDMLDRQTLAAASTSPDGSLLGVSAPSTFEWAVFGVTAVLTAVDLASVAREVSALRPKFSEEPHLPSGRTEPKTPKEPGEKGEPGPTITAETKVPETPVGPGRAQPANAGEARALEAGRGDKIPSPEQIDSEVAIVEATPTRKSVEPGYTQEVELPNEHTWRMTEDGHWCRFSNGRICVRGGRGKSAKDLIKSEKDIDKLIEPFRPNADRPPATMKKGEDEAIWKAYQDYFDERVRAMRTDMRNEGKTTKEMPLKFDAFKKRYTENPELLQLLRGRLAQSETGNIIADITSGKAAGNLGISAGPNPARGEVVYPDFVFPRAKGDGFTAVSKKSRAFPAKMTPEVQKVVMGDIREALEKYHGSKYVRRRGVELTEPGKPIRIDEIVLDYDLRLVPEDIRPDIRKIAEAYEGVDVKIGFFEFEPVP